MLSNNEYETDIRPYCDETGPGCWLKYCTTNVPLDILFLIDDTTSLSSIEYQSLMELVERLIIYDIND